MTDLVDLETFIAAARTGSFARAARQLGVTPALVGRRIQALEERYGARLIERTTRSQRLTDVGQLFLGRAEEVIVAAQELDDLTTTLPGQLRGRVRLSAPTTLGVTTLAKAVARFCRNSPGVTVEMHLTNRRVDLIGEGFDMAVRIGNLEPSGLIARRVGTYRFAVCASPGFLADHPAPRRPADLAGLPCILNLNLVPRNQWSFISADGATVAVEVSGGLQIDSDEAQCNAAIEGAGLAFLPVEVIGDAVAAGRLVVVLGEWQTATLPIHVVYPSRRFLPRSVDHLAKAIAAWFGGERATIAAADASP